MNYLQRKLDESRKAHLAELTKIQTTAEGEKRELTGDEMSKVTEISVQLEAIAVRAKELQAVETASRDLEESLRESLGPPEERGGEAGKPEEFRDLGDLYLRSGMAEQVKGFARNGGARQSYGSPELRAVATDPVLTSNTGGLQTTYGPVIETKYRPLRIVDLLASGTLSTPTLTYWQQGTVLGDVDSVAEGLLKPSINFAFGQVNESLAKIAGITKVSTEMTEDADFMVSIIKSQLQTRLGLKEEDQVLNGNGTAPNMRGLLNRPGIQTYATPAGTTPKKSLDGLFHAQNLIRVASYIEPDGMVVHPLDYEAMRLGVDGQSQYYGGGPFTGAYGSNGFSLQPAIWGLPTVVTPAITQGTVLVGAFNTGAQFFRKGGVVLDSTNSNEDDFRRNLVALRIEERVALALYYPLAFCKVTITA